MGIIRKNVISIIIPVSIKDFESGLLFQAQYFIERAKLMCLEEVETVAIINHPSFGRVKAKNYGAEEARGEILLFLDCDCIIGSMFLSEISRKAKNSYFIGGGTKFIKLTRYSLGIILAAFLFLAPYLLWHQITVGAFWIRKRDFFELGGFKEKKYDDLDFAIRLKKLAKKTHRKFESLKESFIVWSTRKFDIYGDWHWLKGYQVN